MSRGLGSSVTLRMGVITGLNVLAGEPLSRTEKIFEICAGLWKATRTTPRPPQFGGFTVAGGEEGMLPLSLSGRSGFEVRAADS